MKKLILTLVAATTLVACDNGMEEGLESLSESLAAIIADLEATTTGIQTQVTDINADLASAVEMVESVEAEVANAISIIDQIQLDLDAAILSLDNAATTEEVLAVTAQVELLAEAIQTLEEVGDFDYDGIINILDQCPGTEPGVEVDTTGCPIVD